MSLFAKTLLWFLGTAVLAMTLIVIVGALSFNSGGRRQPPFGMLLSIQTSEARHAYETGGAQQLKETLERFEAITNADATLTDASGRDLVTGEDRSDLVRGTEPRPSCPLFRRHRAALARQTADGKYWFFLQTNGGNWVRWFIHPRNHAIILGVLVLLCYGFASYLTRPVERLQAAVERFGAGDLQARVDLKRNDELGRLARAFNQMADRIQTLLTAERRLLQDISHELRSPLARLSVAIELARTDENPEPHLNRIQKEADRLNSMVGELLQVTRAEGDPGSRRVQQVRLDNLVRDVVEDSRIEAEARGCNVQFTGGQPVTVSGDPELLRRAIENIVRNAIRYTPAGTNVEVAVRQDGHIVVRDYGPGVPEDALTRIFDPFYRVAEDRDRASGGVGLGLAIARRAVELHHGQISARNAKPGLEVEVALPV
jgi:two-component system sensor histidine kinase CpxA